MFLAGVVKAGEAFKLGPHPTLLTSQILAKSKGVKPALPTVFSPNLDLNPICRKYVQVSINPYTISPPPDAAEAFVAVVILVASSNLGFFTEDTLPMGLGL